MMKYILKLRDIYIVYLLFFYMGLKLESRINFMEGNSVPDSFPEEFLPPLKRNVEADSLEELRAKALGVWRDEKINYCFDVVLLGNVIPTSGRLGKYSGVSYGYSLSKGTRRGFSTAS